MVAPTAMIARAHDGLDVGSVGQDQADRAAITSRTSRGMSLTEAMPRPGVNPRPSDLARA